MQTTGAVASKDPVILNGNGSRVTCGDQVSRPVPNSNESGSEPQDMEATPLAVETLAKPPPEGEGVVSKPESSGFKTQKTQAFKWKAVAFQESSLVSEKQPAEKKLSDPEDQDALQKERTPRFRHTVVINGKTIQVPRSVRQNTSRNSCNLKKAHAILAAYARTLTPKVTLRELKEGKVDFSLYPPEVVQGLQQRQHDLDLDTGRRTN